MGAHSVGLKRSCRLTGYAIDFTARFNLPKNFRFSGLQAKTPVQRYFAGIGVDLHDPTACPPRTFKKIHACTAAAPDLVTLQ